MKQIFYALVLCTLVAGCTSDEGTLKKMAQSQAEQKWNETIQGEARDGVPESQVLQQAYIDFLRGKSEVEVAELKMQSPTMATVVTTVTTYNAKLRKTLLSVASKVGLDKTRRFNFGDALPMVATQLGMKPEKETQNLEVYKFQKQGETWVSTP